MNQKLRPRCYACGEEIKTDFVLWSLNKLVDRCFLCCPICVVRLEDNPFILRVIGKYKKGI